MSFIQSEITENLTRQESLKTAEGSVVAFFNSQINPNGNNMNISVQIINKTLVNINAESFREFYYKFLDDTIERAINNGWDILKKEETIKDPKEEPIE